MIDTLAWTTHDPAGYSSLPLIFYASIRLHHPHSQTGVPPNETPKFRKGIKQSFTPSSTSSWSGLQSCAGSGSFEKQIPPGQYDSSPECNASGNRSLSRRKLWIKIDRKHVFCEQTKAKMQLTKGIVELAVFKLITDHHSVLSSYVEEEDMNYQVENSNTSSKEASGRTTDEVVQQ